MMPSFSRVVVVTGLGHGLLLAVFVVVQLALSRPRPLKPQEQVTFVELGGGGGGGGGAEEGGGAVRPPTGRIKPAPRAPTLEEFEAELARMDREAAQRALIAENENNRKPPDPKIKPPDANIPLTGAQRRTNVLAQIKGRPRLTPGQIHDLLAGSVKGVGVGRGPLGRGGGRTGVGTGFGPGSGSGSGTGAESPGAWYYAMVRQVMYDAWTVPSSLAAQNGLSSEVVIRVRRDGTITEWKMTRPAGQGLWDESVNKAVNSVKHLEPLPPQFIGPTHDILILFEPQSAML